MPSRDSGHHNRRRLQRYIPQSGIKLACFLGDTVVVDDSKRDLVAGIGDISLEGICLAVRSKLATGKRLTLLVTLMLDWSSITVRGEVRWCEEVEGTVWVGVKFDEPINWHTLRCLSEGKSIEASPGDEVNEEESDAVTEPPRRTLDREDPSKSLPKSTSRVIGSKLTKCDCNSLP